MAAPAETPAHDQSRARRPSPAVYFSIIMPLYNKAAFVRRSIDSVLRQQFTNFELIIVDDGSTDASRAIVGSYSDDRIRLLTQSNQGPGAARNRAIRASRGHWVAFIDADDMWTDNHLDELRRIITRYSDARIVATRITAAKTPATYDRGGYRVLRLIRDGFVRIREIDFFRSAAHNVVVVHSSSVAIERGVFDRVGYFKCWHKHEDEELWARICLVFRCAVSTRQTAYYCRGTGGIMDNSRAERAPQRNAISDVEELGPAVALVMQRWRSLGPRHPMRASLGRYINSRVSIPLRGNFYGGDVTRAQGIARLYVSPLRGMPLFWFCLLMLPSPATRAVAQCRMITRRYYHGARHTLGI